MLNWICLRTLTYISISMLNWKCLLKCNRYTYIYDRNGTELHCLKVSNLSYCCLYKVFILWYCLDSFTMLKTVPYSIQGFLLVSVVSFCIPGSFCLSYVLAWYKLEKVVQNSITVYSNLVDELVYRNTRDNHFL